MTEPDIVSSLVAKSLIDTGCNKTLLEKNIYCKLPVVSNLELSTITLTRLGNITSNHAIFLYEHYD